MAAYGRLIISRWVGGAGNISGKRVASMRRGRPLSRLLAVILAFPLLLTACSDKGSPGGLDPKVKNLTIPKIDPNAPFPALSTNVFDALGANVPELAKHREALLAAERDAIKGALDDLRAKSKAATKKVGEAMPEPYRIRALSVASLATTDIGTSPLTGTGNPNGFTPLSGWRFNLIPEAMAGEPGLSSLGLVQQFGIGHQVGSLIGAGLSNVGASDRGSKTVNMPGEKSVTVDASFTVTATPGSPPSAELTTAISMPLLLLDAKSKAGITGEFCPNSDGKVEFTIKLSSNGRAGSAGSVIYDQSIEAKVMATVGDDANLVNADFDLKQATRSTAGGRQVYVETSQSGGGAYSNTKFSEAKIIRTSSQATAADAQLSQDGLTRAYILAIGALESAKEHWQGGKCIKIEATSPGTVKPGATSKIPVAVKHQKDGSSVPAKVTAQLSGGASVDPGVIAKAPGDITHVASQEKQAQMTIALTATSRRGKAETSLAINTNLSAAYQIVGGLDDFQTNTAVCDIMKPFTLKGGGITMQVSGGLSGTYSYTGPFNANGTGTYAISLPDGVGKPGTMIGGGAGSVTGDKVYTNTGTEKYKLSPLPPCS